MLVLVSFIINSQKNNSKSNNFEICDVTYKGDNYSARKGKDYFPIN